LLKNRNIDYKAAQAHFENLMEQEGLEYGYRDTVYNSRLAQELAKWAETQSLGKRIHNILYKAYFVDDINLGHVDSLVSLAVEHELDSDKTRDVLENRTYSKSVDEDWEQCRRMGIMAVPTYVCDEQRLVGAQTYEALQNLVTSKGA
jgi:predicted DsbA family dithiol-disulfide isomerase